VRGSAVRIPRGYSSESWRVDTDIGELIIKVRRQATDLAKLRSQAEAAKLARGAGVPAPEVLHVGVHHERLIAIVRYMPGEDAELAVPKLSATQRADFFAAFGAAVARLHAIVLPSFTERIGAPDAALVDWPAVVARTSARAAKKNRSAGVLTELEVSTIVERLARASVDVAGAVAPVLTHRDLYLPNVLVRDGQFAALLDFEAAKAWDAAFDFVKLGVWVFEPYAGSFEPFMTGYRGLAPAMAMAMERLSLCFGLEHFVVLAHWVETGNAELLAAARARLRGWLAGQLPAWMLGMAARLS
jgi:aminoglycoside phosphotransferase (APT) family kinase protein